MYCRRDGPRARSWGLRLNAIQNHDLLVIAARAAGWIGTWTIYVERVAFLLLALDGAVDTLYVYARDISREARLPPRRTP